MAEIWTEIDLECNECGDEVLGTMVRGALIIMPCEKCLELDYQAGYDNGHAEGHAEGYNEGYDEGYNAAEVKHDGMP